MAKVVGLILIALGLVGIIWGGFTYTTRKTVIDLGPIQATSDQKHTVPLPPIAGAIALVGGIALLAVSQKQ
ncbi:MAG: DUF3185 domain-containing protein [Acidobacteria bacterium]|nr:DUF3185 domain-containing protein [Acidobacteriota bacterium]